MFWLAFPFSILTSLLGLILCAFLAFRRRANDLANAGFLAGLTGLSCSQLGLYIQQLVDGFGECGLYTAVMRSFVIPFFIFAILLVSAYTAKRKTGILGYGAVLCVSAYAFAFFNSNTCDQCLSDASGDDVSAAFAIGGAHLPLLLTLSIYGLVCRLRQSTLHIKHWLRQHLIPFGLISVSGLYFSGVAGGLLSVSIFLSIDYVFRKPALLAEDAVELPTAIEYEDAEPATMMMMGAAEAENGGEMAVQGSFNGAVSVEYASTTVNGVTISRNIRRRRPNAKIRSLKRPRWVRNNNKVRRTRRIRRRTRDLDGTERVEELVVDAETGRPVEVVLENSSGEEFVEPIGQSGPIEEVELNANGELVGVDVPAVHTTTDINGNDVSIPAVNLPAACPPCPSSGAAAIENGEIIREEVNNGVVLIETEVPTGVLEDTSLAPLQAPEVETYPAQLEEMLCVPINSRSLYRKGQRFQVQRHIRTHAGNKSRAIFTKMLCYKAGAEHPENLEINQNEPFIGEGGVVEEMVVGGQQGNNGVEILEEGLEGPNGIESVVVGGGGELEEEKLIDEIVVTDSVVPGDKIVNIPGEAPITVPTGSTVHITENDGGATDTVQITTPDGATEILEVPKPAAEIEEEAIAAVEEEQSLGEKILDGITSRLNFFSAPLVEPVSAQVEGYTTLVNGVPCPEPCTISHISNVAVNTRGVNRRHSIKRMVRRGGRPSNRVRSLKANVRRR